MLVSYFICRIRLSKSGSRPASRESILNEHLQLLEGQPKDYSLKTVSSRVPPCPPFPVQQTPTQIAPQPPSRIPFPPHRHPHPPSQVLPFHVERPPLHAPHPPLHAPNTPYVPHPPRATLPPVSCPAVKSSTAHGFRKNMTSPCSTCMPENSHSSSTSSSSCSSCKKRKNKLPGLHGMTERLSRMKSREETYGVTANTPGRSRRQALQPIVGKTQGQNATSSNHLANKTTDGSDSLSTLRTFNNSNLKDNSQLPDVAGSANYKHLLNWTRPKSTATKSYGDKNSVHSTTYELKSSSKMVICMENCYFLFLCINGPFLWSF